MEATAMLVLATATLVGAAVQAAVGFGFAIIAAPAFLFAMNSTAAIQVLVAIHIVQGAMLVPRLWRQAPAPIVRALIAGSLIGLPLGLLALSRIDLATLKLVLGLAVLGFAVLLIAREAGWLGRTATGAVPETTHPPIVTGLVGVASGALTSLLVMPGPPLIVYLAGRPLPKAESRAVSLTFFAFCYVAATVMQALIIGIDAATWRTIAWLSPVVAIGTLLGSALADRLDEAGFRRALLALLVAAGILALYSAW